MKELWTTLYNGIARYIVLAIKSLSQPAFYNEIIGKPFRFSLKFFLIFFIFYGLAATLAAFPKLQNLDGAVQKLPQTIVDLYPEDLEATFKNGALSINQPEPYYFQDQGKNVIVIDTKATLESFANYQTEVLITKNYAIAKNNTYDLKIIPFKDISDLIINRQLISGLASEVTPFLKYFLPAILLFTFLAMAILLPSGKMLYLLFFSLLGLVLARLFSVKISYGKVYQASLHLILLPIILFDLLEPLNLRPTFFMAQTLLMAALFCVVLQSLKSKPLNR